MMQNWRKCELGDVITLSRGYDLPAHNREDGVYPIVSSSGITGLHREFKAQSPGVVTGRYGTIGEVFYIKTDYWPLNTTLFVKDFKGNNPRYISYLLQCLNIKEMNAAGAVPGVNRNHLHKIKILLPSFPIQQKIARIISAYDDLIENNLKRIKLLEEMAQITYEEWFVRMRFPGHETTPINPETGLPEGWRIQFLAGLVTTQYGYTESAVEDNELPKFLRITDFNKTSYIYWPDVPNCSIDDKAYEKYRLETGDVIVARMADPGKVAIIEKEIRCVFASYCIRLRPKNKKTLTPYYFYYTLRGESYQGFVFGASTGATRRSANAKTLTHYDILLPKQSIIEAFEATVIPIRNAINIYLQNNARLREARDILLPRLMTGVIDAKSYTPSILLEEIK